MSKLFDESKRAEQWHSVSRTSNKLDIGELLEKIKDPKLLSDVSPAGISIQESNNRVSLVSREAPVTVVGDGSTMVAVESYRTLRTRLMNRQATKGIKSITITSAVPREGKTLTALNLALCYAQLPEARVLLVDADLRLCGLSSLFGNPTTSGLAEVLAREAAPEDCVLPTDHKNLYIVTARKSATIAFSAEQFAGSVWREFIGWSSERFTLILVDGPPVLAMADSEMIAAPCDGLIVVVKAFHTRREELERLAGAIDKTKLIGIVYNATQDGFESPYYYGQSKNSRDK